MACRTHWYQVSKAARNRVWQAYRNGTDDYVSAAMAAITEMTPIVYRGKK